MTIKARLPNLFRMSGVTDSEAGDYSLGSFGITLAAGGQGMSNTDWRLQIETLLERKASIDKRNKEAGTNVVSHEFWLVDAVELLLRIERERKL